jgi:hypothetical protein
MSRRVSALRWWGDATSRTDRLRRMAATKRVAVGTLVALTTVLITACTRTIDDAKAVAAPEMGKPIGDASACTPVDAPLTTIPADNDEEPILKIPQPDGWKRVMMAGPDLIRFTMRNAGLAAGSFAPTAVVTLESVAGDRDPDQVFEAQLDSLQQGAGATDVKVTATTVCDLPAEVVTYTTPPIGPIPPHPAKVLCAVLRTDERTFAATLTLQTADASNPDYQKEADMIFSGFQMLPPPPG